MLAKRHQLIGALLWGESVEFYEFYSIRFVGFFFHRTTAMLTLFSQVMVNVKFPYVVYRKDAGLQIRSFALFKLFPVSALSLFT